MLCDTCFLIGRSCYHDSIATVHASKNEIQREKAPSQPAVSNAPSAHRLSISLDMDKDEGFTVIRVE